MVTPADQIPNLLQECKRQGELIEQDVYTLCYFFNGISRDDGFRMTYRERKKSAEIIKKYREN